MPNKNKHQQQQQQQQIIQHTSHNHNSTATIASKIATVAGSSNQLHHHHQQQHVQQVHLVNSTTTTTQQQQQQQHHQQQHQQQQQQAHMIQVSEDYLEQSPVPTQSQSSAASSNMMISASGEVIQQQQIFKIVSTDAATGNVIIDASANNQNINASANSKVLLSNLTVLSKQQAAVAGVTGPQQSNAVGTAQTINFVNAKHVYTASSAGNTASGTTLCKQQKFSVTATNLGSNFKTTALKQSTTTNTQQYVQQIATNSSVGGQQKMSIASGNRSSQILPTSSRVQANNGSLSSVGQNGQNTAQTMVLQQPHTPKFITANSAGTKSNLASGGNVIKKTTAGTLRMSNSNSNANKMVNNLHTTQGVKTFITQTTSGAQLQQQHINSTTVQQHHVKSGSKSKFVKQYTNAIINSAGAVAITTLPHQQQQQQQNQNISLNSGHQTPQQHLTANHHHKTVAGSASVVTSNIPKANKINSKYNTAANMAAQLPPGTQLQQKSSLGQSTATQITQQYHNSNIGGTNINNNNNNNNNNSNNNNNNNSNIKFVNAQGTIIQQQQQQQSQKFQIKQSQPQQQQHHASQYHNVQHFDAAEVAQGTSSNNIYSGHQQHLSNSPSSISSTAATNSILSDEIMMVNGTQMTDELSARILQSMSQKSFNNQRYQQQNLTPKSTSISNMLPPPSSNISSNANTVGHLSNTSSNNHSNVLLSPRECILYPPSASGAIAAPPQQQPSSSTTPSSSPHHAMITSQNSQILSGNFNSVPSAANSNLGGQSITNYLNVSNNNNNMSTITPHLSGSGSSCMSNGSMPTSSGRQPQSVSNSRSQSMERKLHESSISRKSTDYYKNTNNVSICNFVAHTRASINASNSQCLSKSSLIDFIIPFPSCNSSLTATNTIIACGTTVTTPASSICYNTTHNTINSTNNNITQPIPTTNVSTCSNMTTTTHYQNTCSNNSSSLRGSHGNLATTSPSGGIHTGSSQIATSLASSSSPSVPSHSPSTSMGIQSSSSTLLTRASCSVPAQISATLEPHSTQFIHLQGSKTDQSKTGVGSDSDNMIGEEIRPLPVDTNDIRLQILHAVLLDHTYANPMPSELPTSFAVQIPAPAAAPTTQAKYGNTGLLSAGNSHQMHWSLGGIGAVTPTTSTTTAVSNSGNLSSLATSNNYSMYSSQLARLQQDEDKYSVLGCSTRLTVGEIDPGEETETAPEAEAEDDSVTRCICDLTHDDGYMICCDKCCAWQHVDCMGIDRQNIPDEYLCELCQPRPVDKARARALQVQKRKEQNQLLLAQAQAAAAAGTMGSAGSATTGTSGEGAGGVSSLMSNDVLSAQQRLSLGATGGFGASGNASSLELLTSAGTNLKKGSKILKKMKESGSGKKSKKAEKLSSTGSSLAGKTNRKETKKNAKRKKGAQDGSSTAGMTAAEKHAANLRQWIENYELAVTNHYSPELRARLHAINKQPSLLQSILSTENPVLKELSCLGNLENRATTVPHAGGKILISNLDIGPNSPICELRGKYMLTTQYKTQNTSMNMNTPPPNNYHVASYKAHKTPGPFIFFYQLQGVEVYTPTSQQTHQQTTTTTTLNSDGSFTTTTTTLPAQVSPPPTYLKGPEICVDTRTYGNEARFVRRSCRPNAEIQHLFEKGTIHLFIVALTDIRASTEITIRHEPHDIAAVENKKSNAMVIQPTSTQCACGLIKDCIFGPPLPPQQPPAAKSNAGRKSLAMNGSSTNTGNISAKQRKVNQQNLNRNRSTSSSGDSNMGSLAVTSSNLASTPPATVALGLNSPSNFSSGGPKLTKGSGINVNNPLLAVPLSASCNSNASNGSSSSCAMNNVVHDSGICTSSSSPSVSIPSPTQNMHSPIQQLVPHQQQQQSQPQHLRPSQVLGAQQQQQLMQSLPTPLILATDLQQQHNHAQQQQNQGLIQSSQSATLQKPNQDQQQFQQSLDVIVDAAAVSADIVKVGSEHETPKEQRATPTALLVTTQTHDQQSSLSPHLLQVPQPPIHLPSVYETSSVISVTPTHSQAINMPQSMNVSGAPKSTDISVQQPNETILPLPGDLHDEARRGMPVENPAPLEAFNPTTIPPSSLCSPSSLSSPQQQKSPQKNNQNSLASQVNQSHCGRKTPAKSSRTTSFSEDTENHPIDENLVSSTPNSSSTPKEKPKLSREDRKMEAILRAIEKMERSQQRKQDQKHTKKQNSTSHNTTPTSPNKTFDSADSSAGATSKRSHSHTSRTKKKRKSGNRGAANTNQRKRRQSRINSQESIDGCGQHENDTVTSESDGCNAMHSPPIQTVASLRQSLEPGSQTIAESVSSNVDQAAGLLLAFANPQAGSKTENTKGEAPTLQSPPRVPHYIINSSSPNERTASPPPTPPSNVSSACLLIEAAVGPLESNLEPNSGEANSTEFKYPLHAKTKKLLMNNWLHQEEESPGPREETSASLHLHTGGGVSGGLDSLVQATMIDFKQNESEESLETQPQNLSIMAQRVEEFIQLTEGGSPTPPPTKHSFEYEHQQQQLYGMSSSTAVDLTIRNNSSASTANASSAEGRNFHLPLQVSTCSNNSSVKKRWLRQAISEESHEESQTAYSSSPSPATTPIMAAVQNCINLPQIQMVTNPGQSYSAAVVGNTHIPNGFTTPLKKRRLLLADKEDTVDDNTAQCCSTDYNTNPSFSPSSSALPQEECPIKEEQDVPVSDGKLELQEDIDVDVEKCEQNNETSTKDNKSAEAIEKDSCCDLNENGEQLRAVEGDEPDTMKTNDAIKRENSLLNVGGEVLTNATPSEFNDQEDDVDILRSPSPGQEMIKADDNLVKIEPEDTSGNDDVKIDVEREESMAADDVMVPQLKQECKEETVQSIAEEIKETSTEVKQEDREAPEKEIAKIHREELPCKKNEDVSSTTQNSELPVAVAKIDETPIKVEDEMVSYEINEPKAKRFKAEEELKSEPKAVVPLKVENEESVKVELGDVKNVKEEPIKVKELAKDLNPSTLDSGELSTAVTKPQPYVSSFSSVDSATPPLPLTPQPILSASSSGQPLLQRSKVLSDDDIQARLHNFHKENILFLQSRNKKSKSSNSSSCGSASSLSDQQKHNSKHYSSSSPALHHKHSELKEKSENKKHKNSSSSSAQLKKSKLHKRERTSSSGSCNNTKHPSTPQGARKNSSNITSCSSSYASKKLKSLKKSSSGSSTSSTNSISSSHVQSPYQTPSTTSDKEKHQITSDKEKHQRQRTTSGSNTAAAPVSSSAAGAYSVCKKRQLNFEMELTKDMHLLTSVTTNSVKHKRTAEESQSHCSSKKSKKESCMVPSKEEYKNISNNKVQKEEKDKKSSIPHATTGKSAGTDDVNPGLPASTPSSASTPVLAKEHPTLPHFNNVVILDQTSSANGQQPLSAAQTQPHIPNHINSSTSTHVPTASTPTVPGELPVTTHLPFYNTIYGKLLDSHTPVPLTSTAPATSVLASVASPSPLPTASTSVSTGSLSEYLDTKLKSYNTLGGYVSHSALFGLNNSHVKESLSLVPKDAANEMPAPHVSSAATASPSASSCLSSLSLSSSVPAATSPNISNLKILTKTASHDPRLNPQLTAPEPPPQPKRKLSINEYRKRMQQSTSHESTSNSLATTPNTPPATHLEGTGGGVVINKCTLNSPERLAQSVDSQIQKEIMSSSSLNNFDSLNSSNSSSISIGSTNETLLKSSSFLEEDSTKGQFNAAPTLLEKQQESLCARLKSLKEKQALASALGVVGGGSTCRSRFSSFSDSVGAGSEFSLRKDEEDLDFLNRKRNASVSSSITGLDLLDNCLEEISSTSTSMSSSREPSPERYVSHQHQHGKHLVTASATTTVASATTSGSGSSQPRPGGGGGQHADKKMFTSSSDVERKKSMDIA